MTCEFPGIALWLNIRVLCRVPAARHRGSSLPLSALHTPFPSARLRSAVCAWEPPLLRCWSLSLCIPHVSESVQLCAVASGLFPRHGALDIHPWCRTWQRSILFVAEQRSVTDVHRRSLTQSPVSARAGRRSSPCPGRCERCYSERGARRSFDSVLFFFGKMLRSGVAG